MLPPVLTHLLSPFALLNDMPWHFLGEIDGSQITINETFGFVEAIITCPSSIKVPFLLHNHDGKNIHPTGCWKGTYFSEELKVAATYNYQIELVEVHQFSRVKDLFKDFIEHFYELKKNATIGKDLTSKLIAK